MKLFSEETLAHYGIQGQKWGERRWQNPDGTFNEAGKERYFGSKGDKKMTIFDAYKLDRENNKNLSDKEFDKIVSKQFNDLFDEYLKTPIKFKGENYTLRVAIGNSIIQNAINNKDNPFNSKQGKLTNIINVSEKDIDRSLKIVSKALEGKKDIHDEDTIINEKYDDGYGSPSENFFKDFNINREKFNNTLNEIFENSNDTVNYYYSLLHDEKPKTSKFGNEKILNDIEKMTKTKEGLLAYSMAYKQAKHLIDNSKSASDLIKRDVESFSNILDDSKYIKDSDLLRSAISLQYAVNKLTIGQLWD